jgi:archaellum component FlaC
MLDVDVKRLLQLEQTVKRLEFQVAQLTQKVNYFERERQRIKTDINHIAGILRKQ